MANLEKQFDAAMMGIYTRARDEADDTAKIFFGTLCDKKGVLTAWQLMNAPRPSDGYTALWRRGRLDLTVEALIIDDPTWHSLFTPSELDKARRRLAEYGYRQPQP